MSRYKAYFDLIRYSLNPKDEMLNDVAKMDWEGFFQFADEQGILGLTVERRISLAEVTRHNGSVHIQNHYRDGKGRRNAPSLGKKH